MYKKKNLRQPDFVDFALPFGGHLRDDNRWVIKAKLIPWMELEPAYENQFAQSGMGAPAIPFRIALGALIIKEELKITDEETVEQVRENPYLQYFLGFHSYLEEPPFDASMMVHFRRRFDEKMLKGINESIINVETKKSPESDPPKREPPDDPMASNTTESDRKNAGTLKVDATCTPADIRFPTDLSLVEEARRKSEALIDLLYEAGDKTAARPRTYRKVARRKFLGVIRKRKKTKPANWRGNL
jgi:transposase, IS5 family